MTFIENYRLNRFSINNIQIQTVKKIGSPESNQQNNQDVDAHKLYDINLINCKWDQI
jgi:hypothetical protein